MGVISGTPHPAVWTTLITESRVTGFTWISPRVPWVFQNNFIPPRLSGTASEEDTFFYWPFFAFYTCVTRFILSWSKPIWAPEKYFKIRFRFRQDIRLTHAVCFTASQPGVRLRGMLHSAESESKAMLVVLKGTIRSNSFYWWTTLQYCYEENILNIKKWGLTFKIFTPRCRARAHRKIKIFYIYDRNRFFFSLVHIRVLDGFESWTK